MVKRGDLILFPITRSSWWLDKAIGKAEFEMGENVGKVQYAHVEVSAGNEMIYGARWPRTGKYRIDRSRPFEIWRINGISQEEVERGMAWLEANAGEKYDIIALLTAGLIREVHEQVCSTYAGGYIQATGKGCPFKFTTPDQILLIVPATRVLEA